MSSFGVQILKQGVEKLERMQKRAIKYDFGSGENALQWET